MPQQVLKEAEERMDKAIASLKRELSTLRAGRATPSLLDRVTVDYYGSPTPVNQVANISTPEPRLIVIQPWEKTMLGPIEKAILKSDLGLTPTNDGNVIRIAIPALTEQRRMELVKLAKKSGEEAKVAVRNIRRDANDSIKKLEKNGDITEDDMKHHQDLVQKATDKHVNLVDQVVSDKEKEIMEV
ncbi:ribosome recycling factor [Aneurinibacillus migulanus]|jgi:ribosome recycling factor|uniref:Ribosome-recycling factor n=1 Tax=Aneurinibacillus migulanus TaxID=47500 RepID=A0A0D1XD46_ANEMI|nr:ribosome recycling factor [Aneurinibacillus migulanus]KIV50318.1 ribosome recycling factor [Aneurinibacillus migulanus]KIV55584.1 ribosome recycling factor [Aneurinibacillus migulanus]KON95795.1 ribosome recycling factor [Aneurinibacillus migulanus]KPD06372.1 ribosome recycling factor [Aneurinibacillus migulanus]MCP1355557.1 ribosome recycling factor [Aneurinibacillus migulanus]